MLPIVESTSPVEVFGKPVTELRALVNGPGAALITKDGVFVFTRVYFDGSSGSPQFDLGDGKGRVGSTGQKVQSARLDEMGLWVHLTDYSVLLPMASLTVSWKR